VFRKGGKLRRNDNWCYNNHEIEIVKSFNYIGVVFSSGGSFMQAANTLAGKGLRSLHSLWAIVRSMTVPINIMFNLFHSCVLSVFKLWRRGMGLYKFRGNRKST
jgi:hypothetical protein